MLKRFNSKANYSNTFTASFQKVCSNVSASPTRRRGMELSLRKNTMQATLCFTSPTSSIWWKKANKLSFYNNILDVYNYFFLVPSIPLCWRSLLVITIEFRLQQKILLFLQDTNSSNYRLDTNRPSFQDWINNSPVQSAELTESCFHFRRFLPTRIWGRKNSKCSATGR